MFDEYTQPFNRKRIDLKDYSSHFSTSVLLLDEENTAGGNKFYKLKYNLQEAIEKGFDHVVTMGGAYSNHIAATASACNRLGLKSTGIIRGNEIEEKSITLKRAEKRGMQLVFVSRDDYRKYRESGRMEADFPGTYCLPEGGSNELAVKGCTEILDGCSGFDTVITAVGTGTTLAGITASLQKTQEAIGISVLKGAQYLEDEVRHWLKHYDVKGNFQVLHNYHEGGYAKVTEGLASFIQEFNENYPFKIEPVYTGKVFYALHQKALQEKLDGKTVLILHTGGLQYLL